jgi:hypothetical protein
MEGIHMFRVIALVFALPCVTLAPRCGLDEIGLVYAQPDHSESIAVQRISTCSKVTVTTTITVYRTQQTENTYAGSQHINLNNLATAFVQFDGDNVVSHSIGTSTYSNGDPQYSAYDGTTDYAGTSGVTYTSTDAISQTTDFTAGSVTSLFVGSGTETVSGWVHDSNTLTAGRSFSYSDGNLYDGTITITLTP